MKQQFKSWMITKEGKKDGTAYAYANSIDKISQHYSELTMNKINVYREKDINLINKISSEYGTSGRYKEFGNKGNGTVRNAIAAYVRFLDYINIGGELSSAEGTVDQKEFFKEGNEIDDEKKIN